MVVVVEGIHKLGEGPLLEVEMPTLGNPPLMKRGALCRPSSYTYCGMQRRSEPRKRKALS